MPKFIDVFKKQGGIKLIKQFHQSGALFTAICEFLLLGKSKKALEILRLSVEFKTKQRLVRLYNYVLDEFDDKIDSKREQVQSNKVWVCWFQGMEQAPLIVQKCYQSLKENLTDREIILITSENMMNYVELPNFIVDKWHRGEITHTHMTDLLRLELLIRYGGTWIDATVFCSKSRSEIPDYYFDSDLFLFQTLKPGKDGQSIGISSWYISACSNNKVLLATRELCYEYWKKNSRMINYYLLHYFLIMSMERYSNESEKIVPVSNSTPHILLLRLFEQYDKKMYGYIADQTPFHKLSYKFSEEQIAEPNTFYKRIVEAY